MLNCLIVGIGGFIGTVCRYLIGLITALAVKNKGLNEQIVLMLKVGVCGGFTTFSTFAYESTELMKNGHTMMAFVYICTSIILGVSAVFAAQMLVK